MSLVPSAVDQLAHKVLPDVVGAKEMVPARTEKGPGHALDRVIRAELVREDRHEGEPDDDRKTDQADDAVGGHPP